MKSRTNPLRRLFPRHMDIEWIKPETIAGAAHGRRSFKPQADHRTTIRDFLAKRLEGDADMQEVLALAEQFLTPEVTP